MCKPSLECHKGRTHYRGVIYVMCNVVAPALSSSTTSPTAITSSSTLTPTPEILFPLWSSTKYGGV